MSKIKRINGREILDSRGDKTIEVDVLLDNGILGRSSVPSGASTGKYEAYKLEDIRKAIDNVEILARNLVGHDADDQERIDLMMINTDGSANKGNLGGNVLLSISLACCVAAAQDKKMPLYRYIAQISKLAINQFIMPTPMFNIINGGKHADNNLSFQEFMAIPIGSGSFRQKLNDGDEIFHQLKADFKKMGLSTNVGDEGGFAPKLNSNEEAMELITNAIVKTGHTPREEVGIGIDVAASSISDLAPITYPLSPVDYYKKIVDAYPIVLLEDGLSEDDWSGWTKLNTELGQKIKVIGDDLYTTNVVRLQKGIELKAANGIIIKPDQIGTLTETFRTIKLAKQAGYTVIISHRSGETEATFIADLAVGVGAQFIKTGAPSRGERVAKYNQLLRIEEELQY